MFKEKRHLLKSHRRCSLDFSLDAPTLRVAHGILAATLF